MQQFNSLEELRIARNAVLQKTDYLLLPDSILKEEEIVLLKVYRQNLRDLPSQYNVDNIEEAFIPSISNTIIKNLIS
jgi:hypothetical protein